jgi:thiol-disulfide isomerase/thioredoxin
MPSTHVCCCCIISLIGILTLFILMKKHYAKKETFNQDSTYSLRFFKADWCGHCKRFKPIWDEFVNDCHATNPYPNLTLVEYDIDHPDSKPFVDKYNVRGFPHIVLTNDTNENEIVFKSNRTKEGLEQFIRESI